MHFYNVYVVVLHYYTQHHNPYKAVISAPQARLKYYWLILRHSSMLLCKTLTKALILLANSKNIDKIIGLYPLETQSSR